MALYDNPLWLLSHLRNSFSTSDDTGNAELVLSGSLSKCDVGLVAKAVGLDSPEEFAPVQGDDDDDADDNDDYDGAHHLRNDGVALAASARSRLEIQPLMMMRRAKKGSRTGVYYRPRCNTEKKLERMNKEGREQLNVRTVIWKKQASHSKDRNVPDEDVFPSKPPEQKLESKPKSMLSQLLSESAGYVENPFADYSRHEASPAEDSRRCRDFVIVFAIRAITTDPAQSPLPDSDQFEDRQVPVSVNASITVRDFIGYLCWLYIRKGFKPDLIEPHCPDAYGLFLADSDGSVDWELPYLEHDEPLAKYGFKFLALVIMAEAKKIRNAKAAASSDLLDAVMKTPVLLKEAKNEQISSTELITVILPDGARIKEPMPDKTMTVGKFVDSILTKRNIGMFRQLPSKAVGLGFNLEIKEKPGCSLDPLAPFSSFSSSKEYFIVRENSRRPFSQKPIKKGNSDQPSSSKVETELEEDSEDLVAFDSMDAAAYKEYHGLYLLSKKLKIRHEVVLIVSNERVEIIPKKLRQEYPHHSHQHFLQQYQQRLSPHSITVKAATKAASLFSSQQSKTESFYLDDIASCEVIRKQQYPQELQKNSTSPLSSSYASKCKIRIQVVEKANQQEAMIGDTFDEDKNPLRKVDLECPLQLAREIEAKLNYLLDWHSSRTRNEFLTKKSEREAAFPSTSSAFANKH